jgi:hypothetical protein
MKGLGAHISGLLFSERLSIQERIQCPKFQVIYEGRGHLWGRGPRNFEEREDKPTGVIAREGSPSRFRDGVPRRRATQ